MKLNFAIPTLYFFLSFGVNAAEEIIHRDNYTLSYNEDHEVANWVSYELDHSKLQDCVKRSNNFKQDPLISTGSAAREDYKGSGFDRGHLVPSGDMKFNKAAMDETFYFSNMTPQPPKFNQTRWAQLEDLMRSWALLYKKIWIVTGPILEDNLPYIGSRNQVSVPNSYFKVILRQHGNSYEGVGFIMGTDIPHEDLKSYVTSINEIEELVRTDFFKFLDDESEEEIEESADTSRWNFTEEFQYLPCRTSVSQ